MDQTINTQTCSLQELLALIEATPYRDLLTVRSSVERAKEDGLGHEAFLDLTYDIECELYEANMEAGDE